MLKYCVVQRGAWEFRVAACFTVFFVDSSGKKFYAICRRGGGALLHMRRTLVGCMM